MDSQIPTQVSANLNRLQEQLHELHQRNAKSTDQSDQPNDEGQHGGMVIRGK